MRTLRLLTCALLLGAGAPPAPQLTVHIHNFAFSPATLTVAAGETVRFVNDDQEAHTATATDRSFDSGGLDTNDSWEHRFDKAGTYRYYCQMHPYMKGTIVVRKAG
jgi:plastocyanin